MADVHSRAGEEAMPGDDFLARARWQRTHAITIEAQLAHVWHMLLHVLRAARASGRESLCVLRFEPDRARPPPPPTPCSLRSTKSWSAANSAP
jgi:hypothetical protein